MDTPVDAALLEALYRLERPSGALAEALRALHIDPATPHALTGPQWRAALELYRRHRCPDRLDADGRRQLGRQLAEAYGQTVPGRVLVFTLSMLSPMQWLTRWPRFVRTGRPDVEVRVEVLSERSVRLISRDPAQVPMELNLGLFDFVFERQRTPVQLQLKVLATGEDELTVSW